MIKFEDRRIFAAEYLCNVLKLFAPKDTGNLSTNGIRILDKSNGIYDIGIGGEPAPYAIYTNEPWKSEKWGGKKNPNQGWIQNAISAALPMIKQIFEGAITEDDLQTLLQNQQEQFQSQLDALADAKLRGAKK